MIIMMVSAIYTVSRHDMDIVKDKGSKGKRGKAVAFTIEQKQLAPIIQYSINPY